MLEVEVEKIEIRKRRHRIERSDEAAIAEHVAHVNGGARHQKLVGGDAGVHFDVIDEEFESARMVDLVFVDGHLHRRLKHLPASSLQRR